VIFQVCFLHFQVLNSRWFWFCNFLKLGACVTTCNFFVSREGEWTEEATELFGDLSHVAQWRVLMCRLDYYKERKQGEREGSPLPVIELYDTSATQVCYCHSFLVPYYLFFLVYSFPSLAQQVTGWPRNQCSVTDKIGDPYLLHSVQTSVWDPHSLLPSGLWAPCPHG
jgi:hypothetical protein